MTRRLLLAATLLTALLGGCGMHHHHRHQPPPKGSPTTVDPAAPVVLVAHGTVMIDQGVIRFGKDQVNVPITWRLSGRDGSKLTFPDNGVVFERAADGEITDCRRSLDHTAFTCINRHTKPGIYRYGINVNENGRPLKPLDPHMMND